MSKAEVEKTLCKPLSEPSLAEAKERGWSHEAIYGQLEFFSKEMDSSVSFTIIYSPEDLVDQIDDPFRGQRSLDGRPLSPALLTPSDGAIINYYPRRIDFRWNPSAGSYPLTYDVQIEMGTTTIFADTGQEAECWHRLCESIVVQEPYLLLSMPGAALIDGGYVLVTRWV